MNINQYNEIKLIDDKFILIISVDINILLLFK